MFVGGHQELTGRTSKGGCGQSCCDSVTQLGVEVFERFVEPREGKGCRSTYDDQMGDYSGPRPFTTAERIPSEFLTVPRPCDRPVRPKDEAIVSEQVLPARKVKIFSRSTSLYCATSCNRHGKQKSALVEPQCFPPLRLST